MSRHQHHRVRPFGRQPWLLFMAHQPSPTNANSLWKAGYRTIPKRMELSLEIEGVADIADPVISPDGSEIVYTRVDAATPANVRSLRKISWNDTTDVEIQSEAPVNHFSLYPCWHPAGTNIIYSIVTTTGSTIKRINPDGSGDTTLYSSANAFLRGARDATYNHDGTKIAFWENYAIKTMNADGSGVVTVWGDDGIDNFVLTAPAWARASNIIVWYASEADTFTSERKWRKANADGSGVTVLVNDGPGTISGGVVQSYNRRIWLPDDSGFVAVRWIDAATDRYVVRIVDIDGGSTDLSPEQDIGTRSGDFQPLVLQTPQGEWRIFFPRAIVVPQGIIASVALDGSDYRVEYDSSVTSPIAAFHGFEGDTIN